MDVEVQARHVTVEPEVRALIDERLAMLADRYRELLRVHVTLRREGRHQRGADEVDVVANVRGTTLRAAKRREHMLDAVHAALDALERELVGWHERRTGT